MYLDDDGAGLVVHTTAPDHTRRLGRAIGQLLTGGEIIRLDGDLGTGKTVLTQGIAEGLGVEGYVNSPTFIYVREHLSGRLPLYHVDLYRVSDPEELEIIGLRAYLDGEAVCVVEWPDRAEDWFPERGIVIHLTDEGGDDRRLELRALDSGARDLLRRLAAWVRPSERG